MMIHFRPCALAVIAASIAFAPAAAQESATPRSTFLKSLADCRATAADAARLACYDAAAARIEAAERGGEVLVIDREQARAARRQAFGFNLPSLNLFKGAQEEDIADVPLTLERASLEGPRWVLRTTDGQVWRFTETRELPRPPRKGTKMVIKRGMMGGYLLSIDGQTGIRVRREQ
ncbi:MAG TPA: hypothetical protein VF699_08320 [Caulobacteraceae bacterium]